MNTSVAEDGSTPSCCPGTTSVLWYNHVMTVEPLTTMLRGLPRPQMLAQERIPAAAPVMPATRAIA